MKEEIELALLWTRRLREEDGKGNYPIWWIALCIEGQLELALKKINGETKSD